VLLLLLLLYTINILNILKTSLLIENDNLSNSGMFQLSTVNNFWIANNKIVEA